LSDSTNADDEARKLRRQQRLNSLRGKAGGGAGEARGARRQAGGGDNAGKGEMRRKAISRILKILNDTPADATGMVPGTSFSKAGVARLMQMLDERASGQGSGKVAQRIKTFLAPQDGEEAVHGASVQKLQRAGQMAAKQGGGRGRRRDI